MIKDNKTTTGIIIIFFQQFRDVETGIDLEEVLENVKFSCLDWSFDNKGVFYNVNFIIIY
jgi:hypothetical protein